MEQVCRVCNILHTSINKYLLKVKNKKTMTDTNGYYYDKNDLSTLNSTESTVSQQNGFINKLNGNVTTSDHKETISTLRRNVSFGIIEDAEAKVMVIYTGGTIGMTRSDKNVLEPTPQLMKKLRKYPNLHDEKYAEKRFSCAASVNVPFLVLPRTFEGKRRIIYSITEYEPLLDSSNMRIQDWVQIAEDIRQSYEFFDGFVVLHGTDTLSYTASALSFMLENLGKTVVITGSQIPIFETRTDGSDNFASALIIAGNYVIPEVCVFFGTKLMRGNRTIKISCDALDAFDSPNFPPLAKFGIHVEIDYRLIFRPCVVLKCTVYGKLDENVGILRIFPSINAATIKAFLQPPMKGLVLQSFGSGNIPSNRNDIIEVLKEAVDRGVIIVNCTQCSTGTVAEIYETGQVLNNLGVISGCDMTPEAALTKLSYVLGKNNWPLEIKKQMMQSNLRGEMTTGKPPSQLEEYDLIDAVARSLHLTAPNELKQLGATLFPAMINSAVLSGDIQKINNLKSYGADLSGVNYDNRTALHIACCEGNEEVVRYLLLNGVSVHIRDRYDRTPLMEAISNDLQDIIQILIKCGAHITGSARALGEELCIAAGRGLLKRLKSFKLAGADLSQSDISGRTALHLAALHGHIDIVKFLIENRADKNSIDLLGLTPLDYAKKNCANYEIISILSDEKN